MAIGSSTTVCDRHWDEPALGLFRVAGAAFLMSSWMCGGCAAVRADPEEVRRRAARSTRWLTMAERKTISE